MRRAGGDAATQSFVAWHRYTNRIGRRGPLKVLLRSQTAPYGSKCFQSSSCSLLFLRQLVENLHCIQSSKWLQVLATLRDIFKNMFSPPSKDILGIRIALGDNGTSHTLFYTTWTKPHVHLSWLRNNSNHHLSQVNTQRKQFEAITLYPMRCTNHPYAYRKTHDLTIHHGSRL